MATLNHWLNHWISGEEVDAADFQAENTEFLHLIGELCDIFFGFYSMNSPDAGLQVTVSDFTVTVGGPNQRCIINLFICDSITQTAFTVAPNNTSTLRHDRLYAQALERDVNPFQRAQRNQDRTISQGVTFYQTAHDVAWVYVPGNADGTPGDGGAVADYFATVDIFVPTGGAALNSNSVKILLPSLSTLIASIAASLVRSINGLFGDVEFDSPDGSINVAENGQTISLQVAAASASVSSVNTKSGALEFESPDNSIEITPGTGPVIELQNNGVKSITSTTLDVSVAEGEAAGNLDIEGPTVATVSGSTITPHPTGGVYAGTATTDANGYVTVTIPGKTIVAGVANFYDTTYANSVAMAVQNMSGSTIVFSARYVNSAPPRSTGAGLGVHFMVMAV